MDDDWVEAIIESQSHPTQHHKPRPKSPNNNLLLAISFAVVLLGVILVIVVIIAAKRQSKRDNPENPGTGSGTSWIAPREAGSVCRIDDLECGRPVASLNS